MLKHRAGPSYATHDYPTEDGHSRMALGSNANHPIGIEPSDFGTDRLGVGRGVKRRWQNVGPEQALDFGCIVALPGGEPNEIAFV